jgi:hypothetical protein
MLGVPVHAARPSTAAASAAAVLSGTRIVRFMQVTLSHHRRAGHQCRH